MRTLWLLLGRPLGVPVASAVHGTTVHGAARTRCRGVGDCSTHGGAGRHGGQAACFRQAGARILPSPVNAGPRCGARRCQQSAESGEPRAAGTVTALPCRAPAGRRLTRRESSAMARDRHSQGQGTHVQVAGPGPAWLGRLPRPGGTGQEARVPSCDHDGQVTWAQPAAALPRRWRWISDHCRTMSLLPGSSSWLQCRLTCPATGIGRVQPQPALPVGLCTDPPESAQPELRRSHCRSWIPGFRCNG
jgi:hypothetical protein